MNLTTSWDLLACLDDETLILVAVEPAGLFWKFMIEHVCEGYEGIGGGAVDGDGEDAAASEHSAFGVFLKCKLAKFGYFRAN